MLDTFTLQTFTPLVESTFDLKNTDGEDITLKLTRARGEDSSMLGTSRAPFSLIFRGPGEPLLAQGTYHLSHTVLGEFDLFIVPIGQDADGTRYEAVFA